MQEEAKNLRFEEAAKLKKDIESLELLEGRQLVRELVEGDYDVVHIIEKYEKVYIGSIEIRDSMITGYHNYEVANKLAETKEEILTQYLEQCYAEHIEE
ncbi:MAG: hypothetical protein H6767_02425 [Candidatus Peribacteria bacterium]|nr:MAG: hypothetical protein H6767_02425 [Candidatus Peribacteria bacterium]